MSTLLLDNDFSYGTVTSLDQAKDESSHSPQSSNQARRQLCAHVELSRSLFRSDSDFLVSYEDDVAGGERTKLLTKCRRERTHINRLSPLTADWEEVSRLGWREQEKIREVGVKRLNTEE